MSEKKKKIKQDELRIEKLTGAHSKFTNRFESYEKDLVDFLKEDALENQFKNISITYLCFHIDSNDLVGYITLMSDSVSLKKISPDLKESLKMKGMGYPTLPALKIGRVCVDDRYRKRGIGTIFFYFTLKIMIEINKNIGCRFITLDAKENKENQKNNSVHFYRKLGFRLLKDKKKKNPPMYYDAYKIMREIKEKFNHK